MSADMRSIDVPNIEKLSFTYREDKEQDKSAAKTVELLVDLSKLTAEDMLEWAYSAMIVSYQSKLRSKKPPEVAKDAEGKPLPNTYSWIVPSRGTRSVSDPAKLAEAADKLVDKMGAKEKYELMLRMGVTEDVASGVTGYVPEKKLKRS